MKAPLRSAKRSREGLAALEGDEESGDDTDDDQHGICAAQQAAQEPRPFPAGEPGRGGRWRR